MMASKMKAKSKKVMIVCPHCDKEFDVSQFEKLIYEQGKSDGRKQTYEEVLKVVKFEQVEYLVDDGEYITFFRMIRNWLKQKIKELKKANK